MSFLVFISKHFESCHTLSLNNDIALYDNISGEIVASYDERKDHGLVYNYGKSFK